MSHVHLAFPSTVALLFESCPEHAKLVPKYYNVYCFPLTFLAVRCRRQVPNFRINVLHRHHHHHHGGPQMVYSTPEAFFVFQRLSSLCFVVRDILDDDSLLRSPWVFPSVVDQNTINTSCACYTALSTNHLDFINAFVFPNMSKQELYF